MMSSNKYLGGGGGAPYASFMAAPGYHGQADIQIHRGQTHREQHSSNIEIGNTSPCRDAVCSQQ